MKKINLILTVLLVFCTLGIFTSCEDDSPKYQEKYVLYIGFEDLDENITYNKIDEICRKYTTGYTLQEGAGGWTDDSGNFITEKTLIYSFNFAEKSDIIAIANEVKSLAEVSGVLFEIQYTNAVHSSSSDFPKN